jgi:hypothetical protein
MADDELAGRSSARVEDADRLAAIARLRDVFASGNVSFDEFSGSLELVLAATTDVDLEGAIGGLPPLVRLTPASRRLRQPLVVDVRLSQLNLGAGWQLGKETVVTASTGSVIIDLTAATWDALDVDLRLSAKTSTIDVIIPRGVAIQIVSARGQLALESLEPPLPGAPLLRVDATATMGVIRFSHDRPSLSNDEEPRRRIRRRWALRRQRPKSHNPDRLPPA